MSWRRILSPLGRVLPRKPWVRALVIVVPLLLLLAFVQPLLAAVRLVVGGVAAVLAPLLADPTGRLVLVCVCLGLGSWLALHLLRDKIRTFRAGLLLRRHLDGVAAFVVEDDARARDLLQRVAEAGGPIPGEYPSVRADACLKLARLALRRGEPGRAQAWLLQVRSEVLPATLQRSHAQLMARAIAASGAALPEACERTLRAGLEAFPDDQVLLRLLRDVLVARGAYAEAALAQERVARDDAHRAEAAALWLRAAEQAWAGGEPELAGAHLERVRATDVALAEQSLLVGEVLLARGDLRAALAAWARVRGGPGLARCAAVLSERPRALTPREILECCPTQGGLLLAARAYAERGESRRALRAARAAARVLGATPTVAVALADVLRACGQPPDGVLRLLAAE